MDRHFAAGRGLPAWRGDRGWIGCRGRRGFGQLGRTWSGKPLGIERRLTPGGRGREQQDNSDSDQGGQEAERHAVGHALPLRIHWMAQANQTTSPPAI
jgi:hypothetical protein